MRNDPLEQEARDASNAAISGHPIARLSIATAGVVQCADQQESLGILDSPVTQLVAGQIIGGTPFRVVREGIRGVVEGLRSQPPERQQQVVARFKELDKSVSAQADYGLGFLKGIGLGLLDSAKGLLDLVLLLPRLGVQAVDWISSSGPSLFRNFDRLSASARALKESLSQALAESGQTLIEFVKHPVEAVQAIKQGLDNLESSALEQIRIAGRAVVDKVFEFLELPFDQFGEKLGYVTGMAAFEVLFALATEGIGTALKEAATLFSSGARIVVAEASRVLRLVIEVGGKALRGLESFVSTAGKAVAGALEKLAAKIRDLVALLQDAVAELVSPAEAELATAGAGRVPSNVLLSKGEQVAGKGAGRTTTSLIEEAPTTTHLPLEQPAEAPHPPPRAEEIDRAPLESEPQRANPASDAPATAASVGASGSYQFVKDGLGRTRTLEGPLQIAEGSANANARKVLSGPYNQGTPRFLNSTHLIGREFGGAEEAWNLVLLPEKINTSSIRTLEVDLKRRLEAGEQLYVKVTVDYTVETKAALPDSVTYEVFKVEGGVRHVDSKLTFKNTAKLQ